MLRRIVPPKTCRGFSSVSSRSNKTVIPSIILDQLRDTTPLARNTPKRNKQIFLKPEEFRDRRLNRYVEDIEKSSNVRQSSRRKVPLEFISADLLENSTSNITPSIDSLARSIEKFRPTRSEISLTKYDSIKQDIVDSFKHSQLSKYLNDKYKEPSFTQHKRSNKGAKSVLAQRILDNIWGIRRSNKITAMDDLLIKKSFKLSKSDLFLLLSENGFIIQYLSRVGTKITFDPHEDKIQFLGTSTQVMNAEIILNSILNKSHKELLNLSTIKQLFLAKYGEFSLLNLGRNTEVYFNNLDNDNYELITLNSNQIKRSKRLLLWLLNYNAHTKEQLVLPESLEGVDFLPYKDDDALAWNNRSQNLFQLKKSVTSDDIVNKSFLNDLHRFSDKSLSKERLSYENEVNEAKSLPLEREASGRGMHLEDESWKLLGELGILDVPEKVEVEQTEPEPVSTTVSAPRTTSFLSESQIDSIYDQLTDFSFRETLHGLPSEKLNNSIMTITLGNILYEGEGKDENLVPSKPSLESVKNHNVNYKFNTNVPLANDAVLSLPLFEYPTLSVKEVNHFLNKDPHSYVVQMKFLPSPFVEGEAPQDFDVHNQMKYPPVEIWVDLNERSRPDVDTMNIVTVEGENICYVALPESKSDMKICCQLSGDLLQEDAEFVKEEVVEEPSNLDEILNSTTSRYARFKTQPGVDEFLKKAKLDFSGKTPTSIPSHIDFVINGEKIRYHYINVSYRRQLNLNFGTDENGNERLVQFNIVEGGSLGGRKLEINFVGDLSSVDKQVFKDLLRDTSRFINGL